MGPNALNPTIQLGNGLSTTPFGLARFLTEQGIAGPFAPGRVPSRPSPGNLAIGLPGIGGVQFPGPDNAVRALQTLLIGVADQPVQLRFGEPTGILGEHFFLGAPGSFSLSVGEPGVPLVNSAPISRSAGGSGMIAITFAFSAINGRNVAGWSETYQTADTDLQSGVVMFNRYQGMINDRLNMLAAGCTCTAIRFTDLPVGVPPLVPQSRRVVVVDGPIPSFNNNGLAFYNRFMINAVTDFQGTKALVRAQTAPVNGVIYKRSIWIGGLPDDFDTPARRFMNPGPWTLAAPIFFFRFTPTAGIPGTIKIRDIDRGSIPVVPCISIDVTGLIFATAAAHGYADGQVVVATGFQCSRGGCKPAGQYRIALVDATHFSLRNAAAASRVTKLGVFRKVSYLVNDIASITTPTFTQRKVGRPSDQSRGKSPRRIATRA